MLGEIIAFVLFSACVAVGYVMYYLWCITDFRLLAELVAIAIVYLAVLAAIGAAGIGFFYLLALEGA